MRFSIGAVLFVFAAGSTGPANAAIAVMGGGAAHTCYLSAEFGRDERDGIDSCDQALADQPLSIRDRASTLVNRGILHARLHQEVYALADFDHAVSMDAGLAEAYVNRGSVLLSMKRYDEALASETKALDLGAQKRAVALYDRAVAEEALGNVDAAYRDYRAALDASPEFPPAAEELKRFRVVTRGA